MAEMTASEAIRILTELAHHLTQVKRGGSSLDLGEIAALIQKQHQWIRNLQADKETLNEQVKQQAQDIAAANARVAELEKTNQEQTSKMIFMETIFRMPHNVATGTGISFKIATMQEFNRAEMYKERAEQAEAQCVKLKEENSKLASAAIEQPPYKNDLLAQNKRIQTAINQYVIGNIELLDAMKAALEDKEDGPTGHHEGGVGYNPLGVFCGECNLADCRGCVNENKTSLEDA